MGVLIISAKKMTYSVVIKIGDLEGNILTNIDEFSVLYEDTIPIDIMEILLVPIGTIIDGLPFWDNGKEITDRVKKIKQTEPPLTMEDTTYIEVEFAYQRGE